MEPSSLHLMEPLGLKELLEHGSISEESPTGMDSSWWWVEMEPSSLHLMEPLGLKEPLEYQEVYQESPTETVPS